MKNVKNNKDTNFYKGGPVLTSQRERYIVLNTNKTNCVGNPQNRKVKVKYMWTEDLFRVKQPVIALLHLRALPGDPLFDKEGGLQNVIDIARRELHALQDGGVDGILFANEFSLPYQRKVDYVTVASMARVIGELRSEIAVPYGVNIASNPMAAIDLAVATNAQFVRAAFTGAYLSEAGIINTDVAQRSAVAFI